MVKIFSSGTERLRRGEPAPGPSDAPSTPHPEEKLMASETVNELLTRQVGQLSP